MCALKETGCEQLARRRDELRSTCEVAGSCERPASELRGAARNCEQHANNVCAVTFGHICSHCLRLEMFRSQLQISSIFCQLQCCLALLFAKYMARCPRLFQRVPVWPTNPIQFAEHAWRAPSSDSTLPLLFYTHPLQFAGVIASATVNQLNIPQSDRWNMHPTQHFI